MLFEWHTFMMIISKIQTSNTQANYAMFNLLEHFYVKIKKYAFQMKY